MRLLFIRTITIVRSEEEIRTFERMKAYILPDSLAKEIINEAIARELHFFGEEGGNVSK